MSFGKSIKTDRLVKHKTLNFIQAKWNKFVERCTRDLDEISDDSLDEWTDSLSKIISQKVCQFIPCKVGGRNRVSVPWWNKACTDAKGQGKENIHYLKD